MPPFLCFLSANARQHLSENWDIGQTVVRVNADVVLNPGDTGAVIQVDSRVFELTGFPADLLDKGSISANIGYTNLVFMDWELGETAGDLQAPSFSSMDVSGWEESREEVPGFKRSDAIDRAGGVLKTIGLDAARPYYVEAWNEATIQSIIVQLEVAAADPYVAGMIKRYRDLIDVYKGLYMVYYPTQYEGVNLMPKQIHANDNETMTGGRAVVGLTSDRVAFIYIENVPQRSGQVLSQGTVIPFEKAVEIFKTHMSDILHDEGVSYDLFKVAYEYIPENTVGENYSRMTLYPAWCFYLKTEGTEYPKHDVLAFNALTGEIIDGR